MIWVRTGGNNGSLVPYSLRDVQEMNYLLRRTRIEIQAPEKQLEDYRKEIRRILRASRSRGVEPLSLYPANGQVLSIPEGLGFRVRSEMAQS